MVKRISKMHKLTDMIANKQVLKVGVLSEATYPDGTKVAQVAFWNEYGTKTARPRPFFRNAISEHKDEWKKNLMHSLKNNNFDVNLALENLGDQMVGDIRGGIWDGEFEANSEVTLLLKERYPVGDYTVKEYREAIRDVKNGVRASGGNRQPLIWSNTLVSSIKHKVDDES